MKKLLLFVFFLLLSLLSPLKIFASESKVYVNNFNSNIVVNNNGEVDVTEQITYIFGESRHGMYRKIPISYVLENGKTQYLDIQVTNVSYKSPNSDSVYRTYTTSTDSKYFNIKIGDPDAYIQGTYVYTISYKINFLIESYSNFDKLYLNIIGDSWEDPVNNVTATITMPTEIQEKLCYTGTKGSTENDCNITNVNDKQIEVRSSKIFSNGEFLTVTVTIPSGSIVDLTEEKNNFNETFKVSNQNTADLENSIAGWNKYISVALIVFFGVTIIAFLVVAVLNLRKNKFGSIDMNKYMKNVIPEYNVPKGWYIFKTAVFLHKYLMGSVITAQIIQLCVYGYLRIIKNNKELTIEKTDKPINDLDAPLQDFFNGLMQDKISQPVKTRSSIYDRLNIDAQTYSTIFNSRLSLASSAIFKNLKIEGFFVNNVPVEKKSNNIDFFIRALITLLTIGFIAYAIMRNETSLLMSLFVVLPIVFIINFVWIAIKNYKMTKAIEAQSAYSTKGEEMKRYLQGLHMYIKVAEQKRIEFNSNPQRYQGIFESLLPYAILFGMEKKWTAIFNITTFAWFTSTTGDDFDISSIASSISSFASSSLYSSGGSDSGSSSGSSGGSSGGGGGGGGGGSW